MGNTFNSLGQAIGSVGGLTNNVAQGFTPQNTYQASNPLNTTALNTNITNAQGNLGQLNTQQQALAQALQAQANGQGPNPAQNMLNQQTNQNIQQNAGMIASQKGISPALATQLAAQNQGNMSQQAAASGATLGAQQQLAAQSGLSQVYNNMATQNLQNQNSSGQLINQDIGGVNTINSKVAEGNATANQGAASGLLSGLGGAGGNALSGGSAGSALTAGTAAASAYRGGQIGYSGGGSILSELAPLAMLAASKGGQIPSHLQGMAKIYHPTFMAKGGTVPVKLSPGEGYIDPSKVPAVATGKTNGEKVSQKVPGKAPVKGDSPKNDIVDAKAKPGAMVIPITVMDKGKKAIHDFVAEELQKKGKKTDMQADFKAALQANIANRRKAA